jgi:hypothetical protein
MFFALATAVLGTSVAAKEQAPEGMISAGDPGSIMTALANAGYEVEKDTDDAGDPRIKLELRGMPTSILFYGCDEDTHQRCNSIQFSTGFDREKPWSAAEAIKISTSYRFASIALDDEGDPYISWDINTGNGIPTPLFLKSIRDYSDTVGGTADIVFAEERENKVLKDNSN